MREQVISDVRKIVSHHVDGDGIIDECLREVMPKYNLENFTEASYQLNGEGNRVSRLRRDWHPISPTGALAEPFMHPSIHSSIPKQLNLTFCTVLFFVIPTPVLDHSTRHRQQRRRRLRSKFVSRSPHQAGCQIRPLKANMRSTFAIR